MTTSHLVDDIDWDEAPGGKPVLTAYPDPLSDLGKWLQRNKGKTIDSIEASGLSGNPWTIGFGSTGVDIHRFTVWTAAQCEARRDAELASLANQLSHIVWWEDIGDVRQDVFMNMGYQMGFEGLLKFNATLAAAARGAWETVAADMRASLWDRQTHGRAERLAEQARTGVRVPRPYDKQTVVVPVAPQPQVKEPSIVSKLTDIGHFVFDHIFAATARQAASSDPTVAAPAIKEIQTISPPTTGSSNSTAGQASGIIGQLEDALNNAVAGFVKQTIDQIPVAGQVAELTGLDTDSANAAKALLVLGEQHALTYLSALFSNQHAAVNAVTLPTQAQSSGQG